MWGIMISFKRFSLFGGFAKSPWVGLRYYKLFLGSPHAFRLIRNTFLLGFYSLLFGFPAPIIFALFLNEVKNSSVKKVTQTISYLPHFISQVVVVGMVTSFLSPVSGMINEMIKSLGGQAVNFMIDPQWFRPVYVISGIWQRTGWGAIIYFAALSRIDPQLYDAAHIDGCGRMRIIWNINIPSIAPVIITLLLLNTGNILQIGFEKVLLLYNPAVYSTADVIDTYVYRQGLVLGNFSYATAVNLFKTVIGLVFLVTFNYIARKYSETSLW
jgi:putative aldouronate transport system permease protein